MNLDQMVEALTNPKLKSKEKFMSDMKLFDADGEVHVGDVVRFNRKPYNIEYVLGNAGLVGIVSMCERKYSLRVLPKQIECFLAKGEQE